MIRLVYWLLALIEVLLFMGIVLLFIITDSRTIGMVAKYGMESTPFSYDSFSGNLLKGLRIKNAKYKNHKLFDNALVYWNPLTLINHEITITKVDVDGIDIDNIVGMVNTLKMNSSSDTKLALDYSLALNNLHIGVNPYRFEGVRFSSFGFRVDKIFVDKRLQVDAENLKVSCNSDITNVMLQGNIKQNRLLLNEVHLKNISTVAITKLVRRIKANRSSHVAKKERSKTLFVPFKEVKVKHVLGTLKPVKYGELTLIGATLNAYNFEANPYKSYNYKAKKITFEGQTNMALLNFEGIIKNSTIEATGEVLLEPELFTRYNLPLNYEGLQRLPSKLTLDHHGVWVEVNHQVEGLLTKNSEIFNLDVSYAHHKVAYLYGQDLIVDSELVAQSTYASNMKIDAKTVVNFKEKSVDYTGEVRASHFKKVVPQLTNYLLEGLTAHFEGHNKALEVNFDSTLVEGNFETVGYKEATLTLNSKYDNIALNRLVENIDPKFQQEQLGFQSKTFLDFFNIERSTTTLDVNSNLLNLTASTDFSYPTKIKGNINIPFQSQLRELNSRFNFDKLEALDIEVLLHDNQYDIHLNDKNSAMRMRLLYNGDIKQLEEAKLYLGVEEITLQQNGADTFHLHTNIQNIQKFIKRIEPYYPLKIPNIEGAVTLDVVRENGQNMITISSDTLSYISDSKEKTSVFNINNIALKFSIDGASNIELYNYKFEIDSNPYLDKFYATKSSYLTLNEGFITIDKLWVNDEIMVNGSYDTNRLKGELSVNAQAYSFKSDEFSLVFDSDLSVKLDKTQIDISGDIEIVDGEINYEIESSGLVEDSDIIVLQEQQKEKESVFNNIQLYLKIHNKKPLHYSGENVEIAFYNELSVIKSFNEKVMVMGMSTITDGYYEAEDKRFMLDESHLYFSGEIGKPLLDIKANYHKDQYTVHIFISGTTDEPIINFNSDPYLKQQEILSLILFDGTGSSDGTGAEAYTLLGGTFAKGLMKSLGIDIDHFLLGTDSNNQLSLEIGKKISDNISLMYLSKDGLNGAKVKVEHGRRFETDIIIMPPNTSSIEFLYKRDH